MGAKDNENLRNVIGAVFLLGALVGLAGWLSCATPGPLGPLPPVPDISGPPMMASGDAGVRV